VRDDAAEASVTSLVLGQQIGAYRIVSFLGSGATAEVYAGEHVEPLLARKVAIKALRAELCQDRVLVERFMNEARALGRIRHPNVVDIFEVERLDDGRVCLVMELLRGEALHTYQANRGHLGVHEALGVAAQIASAMQAAHQQRIIHRDLKPDNVFVTEEPDGVRVRVLDFGVAKLLDGASEVDTGSRTTLGTAAYMAPEQFRSARDSDPRADIYGLGCILFELLTGSPPYPSRYLVEQVASHAFAPIPRVAERASVPAVLDDVLARMLAKDRNDRFASMDQVIEALAAARRATSDDATVLAPMDPAMFEEFADDEPIYDTTVRDARVEVPEPAEPATSARDIDSPEAFAEAETAASARALAPTAVHRALAVPPDELPTPVRAAIAVTPSGPVALAPLLEPTPIAPMSPAPWRSWLPLLAVVVTLTLALAIGLALS
jgi:serine/threonine protein kinase